MPPTVVYNTDVPCTNAWFSFLHAITPYWTCREKLSQKATLRAAIQTDIRRWHVSLWSGKASQHHDVRNLHRRRSVCTLKQAFPYRSKH